MKVVFGSRVVLTSEQRRLSPRAGAVPEGPRTRDTTEAEAEIVDVLDGMELRAES